MEAGIKSSDDSDIQILSQHIDLVITSHIVNEVPFSFDSPFPQFGSGESTHSTKI
ncbi:hypothetical protein [uncultured Secundilactobacillus sp.]|uniref:hypothetical protein n=1 Tax=uncultured Secundilactobacillus sp. TaxID=2813935 RepID=UPI00258382DC|nr:hypothetical protein [uncultured Secundilactobacillus sp.]